MSTTHNTSSSTGVWTPIAIVAGFFVLSWIVNWLKAAKRLTAVLVALGQMVGCIWVGYWFASTGLRLDQDAVTARSEAAIATWQSQLDSRGNHTFGDMKLPTSLPSLGGAGDGWIFRSAFAAMTPVPEKYAGAAVIADQTTVAHFDAQAGDAAETARWYFTGVAVVALTGLRALLTLIRAVRRDDAPLAGVGESTRE